MKKSLLALAAFSSFAGAASAQTSVVLYGVIDGAVRREVGLDDTTKIRIRDGSNMNTNRIGFRGTEDLGSGMNAHFVLESGFFSGTGVQVPLPGFAFDRLAFVGVTTAYGSLDIGRVYGPAFYAALSSDPMEAHFTGIDPLLRNSVSASQASDNTQTSNSRTDNALLYTNKFGDLTVRAMYAFGEVAGATNKGATKAVSAVYQNANFSLDAAYTRKNLRADNKTPTTGTFYGNDRDISETVPAAYQNADYYTVGGTYTIGGLRASLGYAKERRDTLARDHTERVTWAGLRYNFTPLLALSSGYFKENLGSNKGPSRKDLYMLAATYAVSKRTSLFAEIDHSNFSGPEFPNDPLGQFLPTVSPSPLVNTRGSAIRNGTMVGVSHAF